MHGKAEAAPWLTRFKARLGILKLDDQHDLSDTRFEA
jgi:hypothetical protein